MLWILLTAQLAEAACTRINYYLDKDGDTFGNPKLRTLKCYVAAGYPGWSTNALDCDDSKASVRPTASETCNSIDDDCDAVVDDSAVDALTWYRDADADGIGGAETTLACALEPGLSAEAGDCDDSSTAIHPGATDVCSGVDEDCDGIDNGCPSYEVAWGDLHGHTNLSPDGCEDPADSCQPQGALPGEENFAQALASGLDFAALTDHGEVSTWQRVADGTTVDTWTHTQNLVAAAEGSGLIPILGYEWTSSTGHRTVLLEDTLACADYRVPAQAITRPKNLLGKETYTFDLTGATTSASSLESKLVAAETAAGCTPTRHVAFYHHPAYRPPASVAWATAGIPVATDTVVEILSDHGNSECADLADSGCDFELHAATYKETGAIQAAWQAGQKLGIVGGSDNHEARPGALDDGPSHVGVYYDTDGDGIVDTPRTQFTDGAVTGVIWTGALDRAAIFDALEARHSFAATWLFEGLTIYARDDAGDTWLPGDDVPAGDITVVVALDDPLVESWTAELLDPWGDGEAVGGPIALTAGDLRYVRIRAWVGGVEERIWASPFFGY